MTHTKESLAACLDFDPFEGDYGSCGDTVLSDQIRKAIKPNTCIHCAGPIEPGSLYRSRTEKVDGSLMYHRWCQGCCEVMLEIVESEDGDEAEDVDNYMKWEFRYLSNRPKET